MATMRSALSISVAKHSLTAIATVFLLWCASSWVVATIFDRSVRDSLGMGLVLVALSLSLLLLVTWSSGRRRRGDVLVDCGTPASRRGLLFSAAFYLVLGLSAALGFGIFEGFRISESVIFLLLAVVCAISAFGHLELCEKGIWQSFSLLPWSKIESYYWEDDTTLIVNMKPSALFLFSRRGGYRIPAKHHLAVDHLLSRVCT